MTEQNEPSTLPNSHRAPDELGIENEAICEKLLGWKRSSILGFWFPSQEHAGTVRTPSFITWADAGLILDALEGQGFPSVTRGLPGGWLCQFFKPYISAAGDTGPLAIRAAALEYIRSLP